MLRNLMTGALWLTLGFSHLSAEEQAVVQESPNNHALSLETPENPNGNTNVISDLEFSPDSKMLAVAYGRFQALLQKPDPGLVIVWDVASGKRLATLNNYKDGVSSISFSANGKLLATGSYDGTVQLWRVSDWSRQALIKVVSGPVTVLAFSPDSTSIAVGTTVREEDPMKPNLHLYQVATGGEMKSLRCPANDVAGVQFSPDGKSLVCAGMSGVVQVWNVQAGSSRTILQTDDLMLFAMTLSHDGRQIAAGGSPFQYKHKKWQIQIWDTDSGKLKQKKTEAGGMLSSVRFSPDDRWLIIASLESRVKLWNLSTGQFIDLSQPGGDVAVSPDGKLLALAVKNKVTLLEFEKLIEKK
ncbi:WD40 repeat domain-containing protein [Gimesia sp.]|uniref:WD40 repeat domain-containing protein n=1 Tax=Gimesia sp. TaxID=2024833 RepID=UPI003A8F6A2C